MRGRIYLIILILISSQIVYANGDVNIELLNQGIQKFQRLIELGSRNPQDYCALAYLYEEKGDYHLAIQYYEQGLKLAPNMSDALINLGLIYIRQLKDYKKALEYFKQAQFINPGDGMAYYQAGNAYYYMGKQEESAKEFEKAYELDPKNGATCYSLADSISRLGQYDRALELFQKSIDLGLDEKDMAYYHMALIYEVKGDINKAMEYYGKSVISNPFAPSYSNLGFIYLEKKEYDKAITQFINALDYMPKLSNAHYGLALCYKELGNTKEFLKYLDSAEEYCNPDNVDDQKILEDIKKIREELSNKAN